MILNSPSNVPRGNVIPFTRKRGMSGALGCNPVNLFSALQLQMNTVGYGMIAVNTPQAIFSESDAQCLVATYPDIFSGYTYFTVGDALFYGTDQVNDDEADHVFTSWLGETATTESVLGCILTTQPNIVQVVPLTYYNYPQNPTFAPSGLPNQAATPYTLTPEEQVNDPSQLANVPGYGYVTPSGNINSASTTDAATQTAQASQFATIQNYTDQLLEAQRENPGFFGSAEGFALIAGAMFGLGALASYAGVGAGLAVDADVSAAQSAALAGSVVADTSSGVVTFGNGVVFNPSLGGASGAYYFPEQSAWIDAATGDAITDVPASAVSLASTGDALASGDAEIVADAGQTTIAADTTLDVAPVVDADTGSLITGTQTLSDGTIVATDADTGVITVTDTAGNISSIAADTGAFTTTAADGTVYSVASDGAITQTLADGTVINTATDGSVNYAYSDGSSLTTSPDGTQDFVNSDGNTLINPDGSGTYTPTSGDPVNFTPDNAPSAVQKVINQVKSLLPSNASTAASALSALKTADQLYNQILGKASPALRAALANPFFSAQSATTGGGIVIMVVLALAGVYLLMNN